MTGLQNTSKIIIYLNQTPNQPRERDYSYAGSFYAFAIWIGLAIFAFFDLIRKYLKNTLTSAILVVILSQLAVPYIMAKENCDDHNRSGRYLTRDIAYNYLNSCAPNAILFTNGDNDTFPLWYAQEVEKIRTDVRVVNLMLLNMDWYIDQKKRKVYESDPLPITLPREKYLMGTNDYIYIIGTQDTLNLKDAINYIKSNDPSTYRQTTTGKQIKILPTNNFTLKVNKQKVLQTNTVAAKDSVLIENELKWTYKRRSLGKSDMVVLDIIANNDWERPIYFVSLGHSGTLGLEDYMQLEGFAYRLVPIKTKYTHHLNAGRIDSDILYKNLMNKFKWGRMTEKDVFLDNFHINTILTTYTRNRFTRLANHLFNEGKKDKAVNVLDRIVELTPDNKIPYDYFTLSIIEAYSRFGEHEKAKKLIKEYSEKCDRLLTYYLSQTRKFIIGADYEIRYNLNILNEMQKLCNYYKFIDLEKMISEKFNNHYNKYIRFM